MELYQSLYTIFAGASILSGIIILIALGAYIVQRIFLPDFVHGGAR